MPAGLKRYYGKGHLHFITFSCYRRLPLLKTVRARHLRARVGKGPRRDGVSSDRVCGHAGARAPVDERTETRNAIDRVAEIKTAGVAEDAQAEKIRRRGAVTAAVRGSGRIAAGILAAQVL